jgi:hypothetical protein
MAGDSTSPLSGYARTQRPNGEWNKIRNKYVGVKVAHKN